MPAMQFVIEKFWLYEDPFLRCITQYPYAIFVFKNVGLNAPTHFLVANTLCIYYIVGTTY